MTDSNEPVQSVTPVEDEGGLRAPPGLSYWGKVWWWFDFLILVKLARLRFIGILVLIGVVITQWDLLVAYYEKWTRPAVAESSSSGDTEYFCPMHPSVVRDNGKEKCPICFMPLSKRKTGVATAEPLPAGTVNRVQLSPYRVVLAGVQTWQVEMLPLTKQIDAVGFVEFNERGLKNVSARVKGRLDQLLVNETGQMVAAGDVLASLYSPDLNVTVQNLLDAQRTKNADLQASARQRLQLLGISDDQIEEILRTGQANSHLKIRSPIAGHVIKKYVREGEYVDEGSPLYDVADLSSVWILAQIYEDDMVFLPLAQDPHSHVDKGSSMPVSATTRGFPGEVFQGVLAFVYPHVDQKSRSVAVRFELENPQHKLRPGMTATVTLRIPPAHIPVLKAAAQRIRHGLEKLAEGSALAIPESSVIDTGSQTIVYRRRLPGTYEGVLVRLGPRMTGPDGAIYYPLLEGLNPGDTVVTSGSFLVDAETRLNPAAGSIYFGGSGGGSKSGGGVTLARPSTPEDPDSKIKAALQQLPADDRQLAEQQKFCPILKGSRLGAMGVPIKLMLEGQPVFICCPACEDKAKNQPQETLQTIARLKAGQAAQAAAAPTPVAAEEAVKIAAELAKLSPEDRELVRKQKICPVLRKSPLGSMGPPVKIMIGKQPVFLCCEGCRQEALEHPDDTLSIIRKQSDNALRSRPEPKP